MKKTTEFVISVTIVETVSPCLAKQTGSSPSVIFISLTVCVYNEKLTLPGLIERLVFHQTSSLFMSEEKKSPTSNSASKLEHGEQYRSLEKELLAKSFQHSLISLLKNRRTFTPDYLNTIRHLYKDADDAKEIFVSQLKQVDGEEKKIDCKNGCYHCCGLTVKVVTPELYVLLEFLIKTQSKNELKQIATKLEEYKIRFDNCTARSEKLSVPCSFLVNGSCSIYEARPFMCRAWNSTDVEKCKAYLKDEMVDIPSDIRLYGPYDIVRKGIMKALYVAGMNDTTEELNTGLLQLLRAELEE